ncbi:efflux RND transporter periplasmic adaptor subunit [bacterium]|nr:efflux RND transporter periplasmic adaptor subunit [bacterium]
MKRYSRSVAALTAGLGTITLLAIALVFMFQGSSDAVAQQGHEGHEMHEPRTFNELYVCSMHPWEASEGPGPCSICNMALSKVEGHEPGAPLPDVENIFVQKGDFMKLHSQPGEGRVSITQSPLYQPPKEGEMGHDHARHDQSEPTYDELHVCSMHPWEASDGPAECSICGMPLSEVQGHEEGEPLPDASEIWVDKDNPMKLFAQPGEGRIPMTESPYYQPGKKMEEGGGHEGHDHGNDSGMKEKAGAEMEVAAIEDDEATLWTCGMHPEVIEEEPGICPICQMDLTPLKSGTASGGGGAVAVDPATLQSIGVRTAPVERRDLFREVRSDGIVTVAEDQEVRVNTRIDGWIEKLYVNKTGVRVEAGEPLLEIYSPALLTAQEEYLLAVKNQENGRLVEAARRRLELWDITGEQIDAIRRSGEVQRTLTLVAPSGGIVLKKHVVEGSHVNAGGDLFTIAELNPIWIRTDIYEFELPWVSAGDRVTVMNQYDRDASYEGRLDFIYPTLDPKHRTAELRLVLDNPDLRFKPEMFVEVRIYADPARDVVAVPKEAVIRTGERNLVFVETEPGLFEPRQVHLGLETDQHYEITHNLAAGEAVVTSGQFLLDSEAKLQEAIQRRIAARKSANNDEMQGHQH